MCVCGGGSVCGVLIIFTVTQFMGYFFKKLETGATTSPTSPSC